VVDRFEVPAHATLRFARYGNVLRLHDIVTDARVGDTVHLTLILRDAGGHAQRADADIEVRGIALPPREKPAAPAAAPPASDASR
jgi:copper(I)-binding protein